MDAEPSTSTAKGAYASSPPKKRKSLGHLNSAEKQTIVNVYKKGVTDQPDMKKANMVHYISEVVGVSRAAVYRTVAEYKSTGTTSDAKKATGRPSLLESFDETVKTTVCQIVHNMFCRNELPTLDKILTEIRNNDDIPNMGCTTLYRFIISVGEDSDTVESDLSE